MSRKITALLMSIIMVFCLCGCDLFAFDTEELLAPPALAGELADIAEAITQSAKGTYTLKYPSRGNYRSAVVQEDINGDGLLEAFAFYGMTEGENYTMTVNFLQKEKGLWKSFAEQKIVAGGVDKIEFCDLDGDGVKEILIGWEIYGTSEMQLAVYTHEDATLKQLMLQKYTHFTTCNLDDGEKNEVLIIKSATAENSNIAVLYSMGDDGMNLVSACPLDSNSKTFNEPIVSELSTGKPAVYIDEIKGVGAVTEVLFLEKGLLVNPLHSPDTLETVETLRSAAFTTTDINSDGILEIPVQLEVPSVTESNVNEKLYLTNWCSFNGEILVNQVTTMINQDDGYYCTIPAKFVGRIAILKDTSNRIREIYRYNPEEMTVGESLFYIKAVDKSAWDHGDFDGDGIKEIANNGETSFICRISAAANKEGITLESIVAGFKIIE